jgi:hypothetical protein
MDHAFHTVQTDLDLIWHCISGMTVTRIHLEPEIYNNDFHHTILS